MKYFCPYCQERYEHTNLRVGFDPGNKRLSKYALEAENDADYRRGINLLLEKTSDEADSISFLCGEPKKDKDGHYILEVNKETVADALKKAFKSLERMRRTSKDIVDLDDYILIDSIIKTIKADSFAGVDFSEESVQVGGTPGYHIDENGDRILHDVRDNDGKPFPKVCGECHQALSKHAGEHDEVVIGLLGSERVAKSSCIVSSIHGFLLDEIGGRIDGINISKPIDDDRWEKNFVGPLLSKYREGWAVDKTQQKGAGTSYYVTVKVKLPKNRDDDVREQILLTFIDMPGEYMNDPKGGIADDWFLDYKGLYKHVDAFWFCIDLVQLMQTTDPEFMGLNGYDAESGSRDEHIVQPGYLAANLESLKRTLSNEEDHGEELPPTAIILTKSDTADKSGIWDRVPSHIFRHGLAFEGEDNVYDAHEHLILLNPFADLIKRVRSELSKIDSSPGIEARAKKLVKALEEEFESRAFFSTSAYSRQAERKPEEVLIEAYPPIPFKTRLPLYWTLGALGKLDIFVEETIIEPGSIFRKPRYREERYITRAYKGDGESKANKAYRLLCGHVKSDEST